MDGSLFVFVAEMVDAARAVRLLLGCHCMKKCRHPASGRRRERTE